MSAFSNYLENELVNAILRGGTYTGGGVYIALFTASPGEEGTSGELSDSNYSRQRAHATVVSDGFTVPSNGSTTNTKNIVFPPILDTQVTITHWGIFDAQNAGNMLFHASLLNPKTLDPTDVLSFPTGALTITLA